MKPKVATARALTAYAGLRAVRLLTILLIVETVIVLIIVGLLAYFFSPWWLLLAVPFAAVTILGLGARWVLLRIIRAIYRHPFSRKQREQLDAFSEKLMRLADVRSKTPPLFALQTIWDIIRRRDATTIRELIADSTSLKKDFKQLESLFENQIS